jgi:hypothetical protein
MYTDKGDHMERDRTPGEHGVDVPAFAEFDAPEVSMETRLARYEVEREGGGEIDDELEPLRLAHIDRAAATGRGVDVPAFAEFDAPEVSMETRLARYEVEREGGGEIDDELESALLRRRRAA